MGNEYSFTGTADQHITSEQAYGNKAAAFSLYQNWFVGCRTAVRNIFSSVEWCFRKRHKG